MPFPTISIATIVKNDAKRLDEYFHSIIDWVEEIVIVDTGSTDDTWAMLERWVSRYPQKIKIFSYQYKGQGTFHYGLAKNEAICKAASEYVLILDADERPDQKFASTIRDFLNINHPIVGLIKRIDDLVPHLQETHERILKRTSNVWYGTDELNRVHEHLVHHEKNVLLCPGTIWHCQGDNHWLNRPERILFQMLLEIERTPKTKSMFGHFIRGIWAFQFKFRKVYVTQQLYKDGWRGFKFAGLRALYALLVQVFVAMRPKNRLESYVFKK